MDLDAIVATGKEMITSMTPLGWAIAAGIVVLFVFGLVKQMAKIAVLAAVLFSCGLLLLNSEVNDWQLAF